MEEMFVMDFLLRRRRGGGYGSKNAGSCLKQMMGQRSSRKEGIHRGSCLFALHNIQCSRVEERWNSCEAAVGYGKGIMAFNYKTRANVTDALENTSKLFIRRSGSEMRHKHVVFVSSPHSYPSSPTYPNAG